MSKTNRQLDEFARKEKWKLVGNIIFLIPLILALLWTVIPNTGEVEEVQGVVIRLIGLPSDEGERLYLLVKLDSDKEVKSYISTSAQFRSQGKVKLYKQPPRFFGRAIYRFGGYTENNP